MTLAPPWTLEVTFPVRIRGRLAGRPIMPITGNSRVPWQQRSAAHLRIRRHAAAQALRARLALGLPPAVTPRCVEPVLVRGLRQRILDHDQAVACLKPVLDGLVDAGWIVDDHPRWCHLAMPVQRKDRRAPAGVSFVLQPLTGPSARADPGGSALYPGSGRSVASERAAVASAGGPAAVLGP